MFNDQHEVMTLVMMLHFLVIQFRSLVYTTYLYATPGVSSSQVLGSELPMPLWNHGMVNFGTDLVAMGGLSNGSGSGYSSSFSRKMASLSRFKKLLECLTYI